MDLSTAYTTLGIQSVDLMKGGVHFIIRMDTWTRMEDTQHEKTSLCR